MTNKYRTKLFLTGTAIVLLLYLGFYRHAQTRVFRIIQAVPDKYDLTRVATFQSLLLSEKSTSIMKSRGLPGKVEYIIFTPDQQRHFLYKYGYQCDNAIQKQSKKKSPKSSSVDLETVLQRYDTLSLKYENEKRESSSPTRTIPYVQTQLWKYCAFSIGYANAFIDYDGVHLVRTLGDLLEPRTYERKFSRNFMVRLWDIGYTNNSPQAGDNMAAVIETDIHTHILTDTHIANDAFMVLDGKSSSLDVTRKTLHRLLKAPYDMLITSMHSFVLWHNQQLYDFIAQEMNKEAERKYEKKSGIKKSALSTWEWLDSVCSPSVGNPEDASIHVITPEGQTPKNISLVVASSRLDRHFMSNMSSMVYLSQLRDTAMLPALSDVNSPHRHDYMDSGLKLTQTHHIPLAYSMNLQIHCPRSTQSPCCEVRRSDISRTPKPMESESLDLHSSEVVFFLHHPLAPPNRRLTTTTDISTGLEVDHHAAASLKHEDNAHLRLPYLHDKYHRIGKEISSTSTDKDLLITSFISVLREKILVPSSSSGPYQQSLTPNFLQLLLENDCVPSQRDCQMCLKKLPTPAQDGNRFGCKGCEDKCGCLCTMLCSVRSPPKRTVKEVEIYPPVIKKSPTRLIPKIIHQTWFEQVNRTQYPKMSRMIESWKQDGWEYRFYDDAKAAEYIKLHFPKEFIQAYNALIPGAFKADFFRYCVLLIDGGVYADIDILLTSNLDEAIDEDVGFMLPFDYPGRDVGHGSCLWNGFLAAAPGHPILAKTLEFSVNMIRNRFTSVDVYDMLCPVPIFNVCDGFVLLYYTGPCMLGMSLNAFLGRDLQSHIAPGEIDLWEAEKKKAATIDTEFYVSPSDARLLAVGKIVILDNLLDDLGAHRFVWKERNMLVCATDMPESDDRPKNAVHYSKSRMYHGVYGVKNLFADSNIADENIRIVVKRS